MAHPTTYSCSARWILMASAASALACLAADSSAEGLSGGWESWSKCLLVGTSFDRRLGVSWLGDGVALGVFPGRGVAAGPVEVITCKP